MPATKLEKHESANERKCTQIKIKSGYLFFALFAFICGLRFRFCTGREHGLLLQSWRCQVCCSGAQIKRHHAFHFFRFGWYVSCERGYKFLAW